MNGEKTLYAYMIGNSRAGEHWSQSVARAGRITEVPRPYRGKVLGLTTMPPQAGPEQLAATFGTDQPVRYGIEIAVSDDVHRELVGTKQGRHMVYKHARPQVRGVVQKHNVERIATRNRHPGSPNLVVPPRTSAGPHVGAYWQ